MMYRVPLLAALAVGSLAPLPGTAAELPAIRTSERNAVPECVTPGRLMAFLRARNDKLDPRFEKIAVHYMRYGEELGLRWDYAFVQMLIETGYLTFKRDGNKSGLVKPAQNNFAGLGAVGKGEPGESFKDVPTGVLAHLQHVLLYAGQPVENPVAERTRKVAEWGVLKPWQAKIKGPTTYTHLAQHWAATSGYLKQSRRMPIASTGSSAKRPTPIPSSCAKHATRPPTSHGAARRPPQLLRKSRVPPSPAPILPVRPSRTARRKATTRAPASARLSWPASVRSWASINPLASWKVTRGL
jgi:hypothetical protein